MCRSFRLHLTQVAAAPAGADTDAAVLLHGEAGPPQPVGWVPEPAS